MDQGITQELELDILSVQTVMLRSAATYIKNIVMFNNIASLKYHFILTCICENEYCNNDNKTVQFEFF